MSFRPFQYIVAALCALAFTPIVAHAELSSDSTHCRVMESRNSYLGYAQAYGLAPTGLRRLKNPYSTLASSTNPVAKAKASEALARAGSELVAEGHSPNESLLSMQEAQERAGTDMLARAHAADAAFIYGSQRTRPDGTLQLAYEVVDMRNGVPVARYVLVSRSESARLVAQACAMHACEPSDVLANPTNYPQIIKAVIGAKIARSLSRCS